MKPAELALAKQLIEQSANDDFVPEKYKDTVRERVLETIQRKVEGQEITSRRRRRSAAARSSTSWKRSRRASARPKRRARPRKRRSTSRKRAKSS